MKKTEKKVIGITLVMIMLVAILMPSISSASTEEVTIQEDKLKEAILTQNDVDTNKDGIITQEEMKKVTRIQIPEGVTDLTGLEYATNLTTITVKYDEKMPDLSKVNSQSGTIEVNIDVSSATGTVKLDFLKNVKKLSDVMIYKPDTKETIAIDYSALAEIKTLNYLSLRYGVAPKNIKDLGSLNYLLELEIIGDVETGNHSIDLNGIENLKNLAFLKVIDHNLQNVSKLGELKNLAHIEFCDVNGISDLSALRNCDELTYVAIRSTDVSNVSFLKNKQKMRELHLENSPVKDITEMKDLMVLVDTLPIIEVLSVDVEGVKIENIEKYKEMVDFFTADEPETENSNIEKEEKTSAEAKTSTQTKTESEKTLEKPTRIPQAGINIVGNAILLLVAMSVVILAVVFVKAKRK